ncbi:hypothetical protein SASPL_137647 [Salvia splendens]|uniref:Uncharacterized protein n=1 Tax=Salvia splendens TaxID=180675 RepID=A0A8X8WU17_SALSN|nr:uncharacterized protein LOC121764093 [Salvia splendens]KAG6400804.1 hypothetical protein SASPL_137647 [Salvia splendens]
METLVVVAHHRNHQYHGRSRGHGSISTRFGSSSPPTGGFRGINCRTFHSGEGLLSPPPSKTKSPVTKKAFCPSLSPKTPSPSVCENPKMLKRIAKSGSIPIPMDINYESRDEGFQFSELWAGPAYSNSPPPSCLPVPKFTLKPKRTISLDLPTVTSEIDLPPLSHSAPASPRERSPSPSDLFGIADSATKTLRRMLNLDIDDE